jgi:hypothetical protein
MSVTVTFNIKDIITGDHLCSIVFNPANGDASSLENSPFTHSYATGTFYPTVEVAGYRGKVESITVAADPIEANINMAELLDVTKSMYSNVYIDQPVYSANNVLISSRIRIYSDSASVGTDQNVLETYLMTSTEVLGKVTTYKTVKL